MSADNAERIEVTFVEAPAPSVPTKPTPARARASLTVEDLLEECRTAQEHALLKVRMSKHGDEQPDPDLFAFLKATEIKAKLLGLYKETGKGDPKELADADLEAELHKRGYDVEKVRALRKELRAVSGGKGGK